MSMQLTRRFVLAWLVSGSVIFTGATSQAQNPQNRNQTQTKSNTQSTRSQSVSNACQRTASSSYEVNVSTQPARYVGAASERTIDRLRGMANGTVVGTNGFENRPGGPSRSTIDVQPRPAVVVPQTAPATRYTVQPSTSTRR